MPHAEGIDGKEQCAVVWRILILASWRAYSMRSVSCNHRLCRTPETWCSKMDIEVKVESALDVLFRRGGQCVYITE